MSRLIVLEDQFEPSDLPPGYYTAYSDTDAYPTLWSMAKTGWARDEGERYLDGGVVQMVASVDMPPLSPNPEGDYEEAVVVIPHSAFTKVVNDYGNWRQMWWREVIQNAIDAGATMIDCRVEEQEDGAFKVSCTDNGGGMSYDTLMNAFFTVGGTEKQGTAHGGFGEAKKLIALAWLRYSIHTRDIRVEGSGAEFPKLRVYRNVEPLRGTRVEVVMPADQHTTEAAAIEYISRCQLSGVRFFVNGVPVQAKMFRGSRKRSLPRGAVAYYNKDIKGVHALLVRSNGLYMFSQELSSDFEGIIVVEVYPKPADQGGPTVEQLFLSNRMGLQHGALRGAVEKIYTQAEFDLRQALREPDALFRKMYKGTGYFTTDMALSREAMVREAAGALPEVSSGLGLVMTNETKRTLLEVVDGFEKDAERVSGGDAASMVGVATQEEAEVLLGMNFKGESHLEAGIKQLVWQPNFININDSTTRERFRLDKKFDPAYMTGPVFALARLWSAFVRLILVKKGSEATWGVGFVFSKEAQGMFYTDGEGGRWVCINPINLSTGKLMSIRDKDDVRLIFEVAMHECAHLLGGTYHGDAFVKAFDSIVTRMLAHWGEAKRIARGIKVRGVVKQARGVKIPEATEVVLTQVGERMAVANVNDRPSARALMETLNLDEEQLEFYLEGEELADFLWDIDSDVRDQFDRGEVVSLEMSYPLVKRHVLRATNEDEARPPGDVIPLLVTVSHEGTVFIQPDNPLHRRTYRRENRDISDVSTRIAVSDSANAEHHIHRLFLDNVELEAWPYSARDQRPSEFISDLYDDGAVVIPADIEVYQSALRDAVRYEPDAMIRDASIRVNVSTDTLGRYHMHPADRRVFDIYRYRFDGDPYDFELVLEGEGRETDQLKALLSGGNMSDLREGFSTAVSVPTRLFERWLYNHEADVRRDPWAPQVPEGLRSLVQDKVQVMARNLGDKMIELAFSGPEVWGLPIARKYMVMVSQLNWYADVTDINDLVTRGHLPHEVHNFWTMCKPGWIMFDMSGRVFEGGVERQLNEVELEPGRTMPVWIQYLEEPQYFSFVPVIEAHEQFFKAFTDSGEGRTVKANNPDSLDRVTRLVHQTYNCGATPAGQEEAFAQMDHLLKEGRPVMVAMDRVAFENLVTRQVWVS